MPELPEVETTTRGLRKKISNLFIKKSWYDEKKFQEVDFVVNKKIKDIKRKGKNIILEFFDNSFLLIHMKMTGHLLYGKWFINGNKLTPLEPDTIKEKINSYIHFILIFDNDFMLGFSDMRKFGKVKYFESYEKLINSEDYQNIANDILEMDFNDFFSILKNKNSSIYKLILDQRLVSGIGNIYANDSLFLSKIHPEKKAIHLKEEDFFNLFNHLQFIIKKSIELGGASLDDYRDTDGLLGGYVDIMVVYGKSKSNCINCKENLQKIKVATRGIVICPNCQRM